MDTTSDKITRIQCKSKVAFEHQEDKIMTAEEIYNFHMDNEDTEMPQGVTDLVSVINSNGDCSQEVKRKLRLGRVAVERLGKITKNKDVSLETSTLTIHSYHQLPCSNMKAGL